MGHPENRATLFLKKVCMASEHAYTRVMANHTDSPPIEAAAKKLGISTQYLASILAFRIRPGAPLALRICELYPDVQPHDLRPDIFEGTNSGKVRG